MKESLDCAQCKHITIEANEEPGWDINSLYSRLTAGSCDIFDDKCWKFLVDVMKRAGFIIQEKNVNTEGSSNYNKGSSRNTAYKHSLCHTGISLYYNKSPSATVPSRVTIAVVKILTSSLKSWGFLQKSNNRSPPESHSQRVFLILRYTLWLCGDSINRRVLLHHGILVNVQTLLVEIRKLGIDVFGSSPLEPVDDKQGELGVVDICAHDWITPLLNDKSDLNSINIGRHSKPQAHTDSQAVSPLLFTADKPQAVARKLFKQTLYLCTLLFDPEMQFLKYLSHGTVSDNSACVNLIDNGDTAESVARELLKLCAMANNKPSRSHFSSLGFALFSSVGCMLVSRCFDENQTARLHISEIFAKSLETIEIDEAYIAWRILMLVAETTRNGAQSSSSIADMVSTFWARVTTQTNTTRLLSYSPIFKQQHRQEAAMSDIKRQSLEMIFSFDTEPTGDFNYIDMHDNFLPHTQIGSPDLDLSSISDFMLEKDTSVFYTRLRRCFDSLSACVLRYLNDREFPSFVQSNISIVNHLLISTLGSNSPKQSFRRLADSPSISDEDSSRFVYLSEYIRFLWNICSSGKRQSSIRTFLRTIEPGVWDSLLSQNTINICAKYMAHEACTQGTASASTVQSLFTLCAWLVARSLLHDDQLKNQLLELQIIKLIFARTLETIVHVSDLVEPSGIPLVLSTTAAIGRGVSQGMLLICWASVPGFQRLLHETQGAQCLLASLYSTTKLFESLHKQTDQKSEDIMCQSISGMSVVSLPDESLWNLADVTTSTDAKASGDSLYTKVAFRHAEHLLTSLMLILDSIQLLTPHLSSIANSFRPMDFQIDPAVSGAFKVTWQLVHSASPKGANKDSYYMKVLSYLESSKNDFVADFAGRHIARSLQFLIAIAFNGQLSVGVEASHNERIASMKRIVLYATEKLSPVDLSSLNLISRHTKFLKEYHIALIRAMAMLDNAVLSDEVKRIVVCNNALENLLGALQLVATLETPGNAALEASFYGMSEFDLVPQPEEFDIMLGTAIGEVLSIISLLIHDSQLNTEVFNNNQGHTIIHTCVTKSISHFGDECRSMAIDGVLSLLSGFPKTIVASAIVPWESLRIDAQWIQTLVEMYPELKIKKRISVLWFVGCWCEHNNRAKLMFSQSMLPRLCLEELRRPLYNISSEQDMPDPSEFIQETTNYVQALGRMLSVVFGCSISAGDLKFLFRVLVSGPSELLISSGNANDKVSDTESEFITLVRRMLSSVLLKASQLEAGGSYFSFDGQPAALSSTHFHRISDKGFTFSTWIFPDQIVMRHESAHILAAEYSSQTSLSTPGFSSSSANQPEFLSGLLPDGVINTEPKPTQGTILCLTASDNSMFVISHNYISQGIEIQTTINGTENQVKCAIGEIKPNHWYSLAVCYAPTKRRWSPFGSPNLYVYINGSRVYKGPHPFIEGSTYKSCYIGSSPVSLDHNNTVGDGKPDQKAQKLPEFVRSFSGRIANISMFDGILRPHDIELIHHLGPRLSTQFRKAQISDPNIEVSLLMQQTAGSPTATSRSNNISSDISDAFQNGNLASRLILSLHADATSGDVCMDLSPIGICQTIVRENLDYKRPLDSKYGTLTKDATSQGTLNRPLEEWETNNARARLQEASQPWRLCGDIIACNTSTVHQSLLSLGGLEVVVVLLKHLDWIGPGIPPTREGPLGTDEGAFDPKSQDHAPLPLFFYLLRDILCGNPRHLIGIQKLNFVPLIATILQKSLVDPSTHLTIAALRAIQSLQVALDKQGGLLPAAFVETSALWSQIQHDLVLNINIWRRASFETQLLYLQEVHRILCIGRRDESSNRRNNASANICGKDAGGGTVGIRWLLYVLFDFYPYDSSQHIQKQQQQQQQQQNKDSSSNNYGIHEYSAQAAASKDSFEKLPMKLQSGSVALNGYASMSNDSVAAMSTGGYDDDFGDEYTGNNLPGFQALPRHETIQLRKILLRTLELFLSASEDRQIGSSSGSSHSKIPEVNKADISHLVHHLMYACNRDAAHTKEILQLLFRCLADGTSNATSLASRLLAHRGLNVLFHIIDCDDGQVAAEAINIITLLMTISSANKENETTASRLATSLRVRPSISIDPEDINKMLSLVRNKRVLTPSLYKSLLALALGDQASLLASANLATETKSNLRSVATKRTHHVRNLSTSPSGSEPHQEDAKYSDDAMDVGETASYIQSLPSRHINIVEAADAIIELSYAPDTLTSMRIIVINDLQILLEEEPQNFSKLATPVSRILNPLFTMVVLSGYTGKIPHGILSDNGAETTKFAPSWNEKTQSYQLADEYTQASDQLSLISHTTLSHQIQNLAINHKSARKVWVHRQVQYINQMSLSGEDDEPAQSLAGVSIIKAKAETALMAQIASWAHVVNKLIHFVIWRTIETRANIAEEISQSLLSIWTLTPSGAVSLTFQIYASILETAHSKLTPELLFERSQESNDLIVENLAELSLSMQRFIFDYHQYQEYIAFHHEKLKVLSSSSQSTSVSNIDHDHNAMYRSQNSPWDDTPELARELVRFMLKINEHHNHLKMPTCYNTLRLVTSGIRSMKIKWVRENLALLLQLLERHPYEDSASDSTPSVCKGGCGMMQTFLAELGYIHESYMFCEEQSGSGISTPQEPHVQDRSSENAEGKSCNTMQDEIVELYMALFRWYRTIIDELFPDLLTVEWLKSIPGGSKFDTDQSSFVEFVQSQRWQDIYHSNLMPAMRIVEEIEMKKTIKSQEAFSREIQRVLGEASRYENALVRLAKDTQTLVANNTLSVEADESLRVNKAAMDGANWIPGGSRGPWPKIWHRRLKGYSGVRGPWRAFGAGAAVHWMLDTTEDHSRMRRRLVRNEYFDDHSIAANRRDRTGSQKTRTEVKELSAGAFDNDAEGIPKLTSLASADGVDPAMQLTGDEEWNLVTPEDLAVVSTAESGRILLSVPCERIALLNGVYGQLELSKTTLKFTPNRDNTGSIALKGVEDSDTKKTKNYAASNLPHTIFSELRRELVWQVADIHQIHFRRYMLRKSAVEIFFSDRKSVFFNVPNKKDLFRVVLKISSMAKVNEGLSISNIRSAPELLKRLKLTERWQHGELSNFDYLMGLNTIAGRSYNDLSQYPVFPWVISDYTSKKINLKDPAIYRDLSQPMGALNKERLQTFIERYENFEDPTGRIKKFHYGTHYSSAASVAYYLIRLEPFASIHVLLQSGKFDHADRQFHSMADVWNSCTSGPGDVKELIPEFYYMPEFLDNHNALDLGTKQNGDRLGDVILPPWAASASDFVRINRMALESDYVSANLHKWIDLVFGHKQRGPAAVRAHNVFYYLTYEGAVNLDAIRDPVERASVESQIHYFGQTPTQLFVSPHPPRHPRLSVPRYRPIVDPVGTVQHFVLQISNADIVFVRSPQMCLQKPQNSGTPPWPPTETRQLASLPNRLAANDTRTGEIMTTMDAKGRVSVHKLTFFVGADYNFQLSIEPLADAHCLLTASAPYAAPLRSPVECAVVPGLPQLLISCAHYDGSVRCTRIAADNSFAADSAQPAVLTDTDRGLGMTNAYAGAVVNAMTRTDRRPDTKPQGSLSLIFGATIDGKNDTCNATLLAARLLEPMAATSCVYLGARQTCVTLGEDSQSAVVGSSDGSVALLKLHTEQRTPSVPLAFIDPMNPETARSSMAPYAANYNGGGTWILNHILVGHDDKVLDVAVSCDADVVASASADGSIILWTHRAGQYLRTLHPVSNVRSRAERVLIAADALILCYTLSGSSSDGSDECAQLHVYNINGYCLCSRRLTHRIADLALTFDGKYGACVSADSRVAVFDVFSLVIVRQFELPACGYSVAWSTMSEQQLLVGCEGGKLVVISVDISLNH